LDAEKSRELSRYGANLEFLSHRSISIVQVERAGGLLLSFTRPRPNETPFEFQRRMMEVTPAQVSWLMPSRLVNENCFLLLDKSTNLPRFAKDIYEVKGPSFRGFQVGRPDGGAYEIRVFLFSDVEQVHLDFRGRPGSPPFVTQGDINLVVQTLRSVADDETH
jgi:hypothetical protein